MGWGKLNRKCQVSNRFFLGGGGGGGAEVANSYKHVFGRDGRVKGRDTALQKKAYKNRSSKVRVLKVNINYFYRLYINDVDFLYNESSYGFVSQ